MAQGSIFILVPNKLLILILTFFKKSYRLFFFLQWRRANNAWFDGNTVPQNRHLAVVTGQLCVKNVARAIVLLIGWVAKWCWSSERGENTLLIFMFSQSVATEKVKWFVINSLRSDGLGWVEGIKSLPEPLSLRNYLKNLRANGVVWPKGQIWVRIKGHIQRQIFPKLGGCFDPGNSSWPVSKETR